MPGGSIDEPSIPLHPARHLLLPLGCINVHGGVLVDLTLYQQLGQLGHHLLLQPSPDWSCTIYPEPQKYESVFNPINENLRHGNLSNGMPPPQSRMLTRPRFSQQVLRLIQQCCIFVANKENWPSVPWLFRHTCSSPLG